MGAAAAEPSFNRTVGEVRVGTCAGLKTKVELGLDISIVITSDLLCYESIALSSGQQVSIASEAQEQYGLFIAEDFATPDPSSATLLVNPPGSFLLLEGLVFSNEAGVTGSPGAVRAVRNAGSLDVNQCSFLSLNYGSMQDGGAVSLFALCRLLFCWWS